MVQIVAPGPAGMQAEKIGQALGMGIGQNIGMKNQQQQQGQLAKALFGDQAQQFANLPMQEQLKYAQHMQNQLQNEERNKIELYKAMNRPPPGGVTSQPTPPEVSNAIENILQQNQEASADQLRLQMDKAGVPSVYSNPYIENRRQSTKPTFEPESERLEAKRVADLATEIEKNYMTARNEDIRLDRMEQLSEKNDISTPAMMKVLDTVGLPIGILANPETEEYRKLETDFIRDARDIFPGGRITNYEIQSYLKTIPTLMNSKDGRKAIIHNRKLLNEAKKVRYDEYKNIIKENGGKKPPNLSIMLEERIAGKIMEIEDKFKEGIDKSTQKHQQPIRMIDPNGKPVDIPPNMIEKAIKAGAQFQ